MSDFGKKIYLELKKIDPSVKGVLKHEDKELKGEIFSSIITEDNILELCKEENVVSSVIVKDVDDFLVIDSVDEGSSEFSHNEPEKRWQHRAEVSVVYQGYVPLSLISKNSEFKVIHPKNMDKARGPIQEFKFLTPIVVDKNLNVIDGSLRVEIALKEKFNEVPVIVLDLDMNTESGKKVADGLRLFLNRSSEFQRWNYDHVDAYIDENVQLQPILEPLGLFSNNILPVSFFSNSILKYEIDEYNDQQKTYKQEIGIAEWAKIMRERDAEKKLKREERRKPKPDSSEYSTLFELVPTEKDFMETHDVNAEIEKAVEETKEMAQTVTENYDEVMKEKKAEKGIPWQRKKRKGSEVVEAKRRKAIDKAFERLLKEKTKKEESLDDDKLLPEELLKEIEKISENKYESEEKDILALAEKVKFSE